MQLAIEMKRALNREREGDLVNSGPYKIEIFAPINYCRSRQLLIEFFARALAMKVIYSGGSRNGQWPKRSWCPTEDGICIWSTDGTTYFVLSTYFILHEKCPFYSFALGDVHSVLVAILGEPRESHTQYRHDLFDRALLLEGL